MQKQPTVIMTYSRLFFFLYLYIFIKLNWVFLIYIKSYIIMVVDFFWEGNRSVLIRGIHSDR